MNEITDTKYETVGLLSKLPIINTKTPRRFLLGEGKVCEVRKIGNETHELNYFDTKEDFSNGRQIGHYITERDGIIKSIGTKTEDGLAKDFARINNELVIQKRLKKFFQTSPDVSRFGKVRHLGLPYEVMEEYNDFAFQRAHRDNWAMNNISNIRVRNMDELLAKAVENSPNDYIDISQVASDEKSYRKFDDYMINGPLISTMNYYTEEELSQEDKDQGVSSRFASRSGITRLFPVGRSHLLQVFPVSSYMEISETPVWGAIYRPNHLVGVLPTEVCNGNMVLDAIAMNYDVDRESFFRNLSKDLNNLYNDFLKEKGDSLSLNINRL